MRVKSTVYSKRSKKRYFRLAKGYYSDKGRRWRQVVQQVEKSLAHSYRGRKDRKGDFRKLWISRINALGRQCGLSYNKLIFGLRKSGVTINRKILARMAIDDVESFRQLTQLAKTTLETANSSTKKNPHPSLSLKGRG